MGKHLLLIGITESHTQRVIRRIHALDCEVTVADSNENLAKHDLIIAEADRTARVDFRSGEAVSALARRLERTAPLTAIFSFKEEALLATAAVQRELGMPGNDPWAVAICIDKLRTRDALRRAGLPNPSYALCRTVEEVASFGSRVGFPIVVKPHNLQGSVGVTRVDDIAGVGEAVRSCLRQCAVPLVMAEAFVVGKEVSMEGVIHHGKVVLLSVTEKELFPDTFVEAGHTTPYDGREVPYEGYAELLDKVVRAVGLTFGPLHVELFLTEAGPVVGEVHARYGGGAIPTLLERALGTDVQTPILGELVGAPVDIEADLWARPRAVSAMRFFSPAPGRLRAVRGLEEAARLSGVVELNHSWSIGDVVAPIRSSHDRGGYVIVEGRERADVEEVLREVNRRVAFVTESLNDSRSPSGRSLSPGNDDLRGPVSRTSPGGRLLDAFVGDFECSTESSLRG